jgi:DNA-binding MarR family transcriptional regulator
MGRRSLFGERKFKPLDRPLTAKQDDILHFLWAFYMQNDQLPPVNQICDEFLIYPQAGTDHLKALARKGYIEPNACPGKFKFTQKARAHFAAAAVSFDSLDSHGLQFCPAEPLNATQLNGARL